MRPDWDTYFLTLAEAAATRATCSRLKVGCVLVKERVVVSTGYNGAPRGIEHCKHEPGEGSCQEAVHAEANAIVTAARMGQSTSGTTAYVTHRPCHNCYRLMINAGVVQVYYNRPYGDAYLAVSTLPMRSYV